MARSSVQSASSAVSWTCRQCRLSPKIPSRTAAQWLRPLARRQPFSTTPEKPADIEPPLEIHAAPEINFEDDAGRKRTTRQSPARIIPVSPSYFTGSPVLNDNTLLLQSLTEKYWNIPTVAPDQAPRAYWKTLAQYRASHGERVSASKYSKILQLLNQLNKIHPNFCPDEIQEVLDEYLRPSANYMKEAEPGKIDAHGRSLAVGRRKASTARVWLVEGTGEVLINDRSIIQAFPRIHDRESALWALRSTERMDKYNVFAVVSGGGVTGQAEAITLALTRALLVHEPALKPALRRAGCVTSDARRVERKKAGRLKARKKPAWNRR